MAAINIHKQNQPSFQDGFGYLARGLSGMFSSCQETRNLPSLTNDRGFSSRQVSRI